MFKEKIICEFLSQAKIFYEGKWIQAQMYLFMYFPKCIYYDLINTRYFCNVKNILKK